MSSLDLLAGDIARISRANVVVLQRLLDAREDARAAESHGRCPDCDRDWSPFEPCDCECKYCGEGRDNPVCWGCGGEEFSSLDARIGRAVMRKEAGRG